MMGVFSFDNFEKVVTVCLHCARDISKQLDDTSEPSYAFSSSRQFYFSLPLSLFLFISRSLCPSNGEKAQINERPTQYESWIQICMLLRKPLKVKFLHYKRTLLALPISIFLSFFRFFFLTKRSICRPV